MQLTNKRFLFPNIERYVFTLYVLFLRSQASGIGTQTRTTHNPERNAEFCLMSLSHNRQYAIGQTH